MNKTLEVLLTLLALAGLYCTVPKSISGPDNSEFRAEQTVIVADGSDPMPLCPRRGCD
jgi:hypothetical protein